MKPQKKAIIAQKAAKTPVAKKHQILLKKTVAELKKVKNFKKTVKPEELKQKLENKKKMEEKKKSTDRKKVDDKKDKSDKVEEKKKQSKEAGDKKVDKTNDKKAEEKIMDEEDKKKKAEDKVKVEKQSSDVKKKEEKKRPAKESETDQSSLSSSCTEDNETVDSKADTPIFCTKKKASDKKAKSVKPVAKKVEKKKDDANGKVKKEAKKSPPKKTCPKKTVLVKKSAVAKKFITKKMKLVKSIADGDLASNEDECAKKLKKKTLARTKIMSERKLKLEKQTKTKLAHKYTKASATTKKEEKSKNVVEKAVVKKKSESKESDKGGCDKKAASKEEDDEILSDIKREIVDDKECEKSRDEAKKVATKSAPKSKKLTKKQVKGIKENSVIKDGDSSDEQSKPDVDGSKVVCKTKQENGDSFLDLNLKVEESSSESNMPDSDESEDYDPKRKSRSLRRKDRSSSPEERSRRMRLFGFWSGPKRHRVASLNALAKVHCLYENEAGGVYLGGFCKPKPEKDKEKEKDRVKKCKEEKDEKEALKKEKEKEREKEKEKEKEKTKEKEKDSSKQKDKKVDTPKRKLRKVPGLRGKHWEMSAEMSSSSSSDEDYESDKEKEPVKKPPMKQRKKKHEETMDLKDMVVCKRMASLNASAILAASYSDEKHLRGSSSSETSSSDSEVEIIKRKKYEYDYDKRKARQSSDIEEVVKPSNKVVIVNQDTDVTITGVYVNQTRSTHHEGFCSIAGMQYRISSTSHTQTAATAVATELREQKLEQPCKSYTPLGALSSMTVPGGPGGRANMSPRRHSAFSAPHQHGYYQPAGPLIQHPSTLPPIKGPPPDSTPTPPQNSEGSDDLVTPLSTSGGNSSAGGAAFYRAYCPQYYGTPPQYPELCYPPTYTHAHPHAPPYYKYTPYRRQYYGYQESGGTVGPTGASGAPGVVEYQPPLPSAPGDYSLPPYYSGYPPPPPPPPPPQPNPAYLHSQGRAFVDHAAFQSCPCPMQSCPKNVDTGPLIGNGKGAPVVSGPGLSLPPSALVGPPSPARGRAGLAPPHGANAWDTDRVQHNNHRSHKSQNQSTLTPANNHVPTHNHHQNSNRLSKDDKNCVDGKLQKCGCQQHACTSTCDVKLESLSPTEKLSTPNCPSLKMENNNVKCESCSVDITENITCVANCNVKCESEYKCESLKCEQCAKACLIEMDKDSGIVIDDKCENDAEVKEELSDVVIIDNDWKKPDYEPTVTETVEEDRKEPLVAVKSQQLNAVKRKLAADGQPDLTKKRKISKKSVDTAEVEIKEETEEQEEPEEKVVKEEVPKKKAQKKKSAELVSAAPVKKSKVVKLQNNVVKINATESSIMETINDVVMKSLQMAQKKEKESKKKPPVKKKPKSDKENVIVKKIANKLKNVVAEKINNIKNATDKKVSLDESQLQKPVSEKIQVAKVEKSAGEKVSLSKVTTEKEPVAKTDGKAINLLKGKVVGKQKTKLPLSKKKNNAKFKTQEVKDTKNVKVQETKEKKEAQVKNQVKPKTNEVTEELSKKKKIKIVKKATKKVLGKAEESTVLNENLPVTKKQFVKPKWSNGWSWEGEPYEAKVYLTNEGSAIRRCYASMRHMSGDVLRPRDCVLLKSGPRKADLPYVAKIAALWENPEDGEMMFSLLWYYRPEHTEQGRTEFDTDDEVFASRHRDANSVACIEDKCYILTFNEYCRYRKNLRRIEEGLESPGLIVPPGHQTYPRESRQPPIPVPSDMVLFCRRVYDYRGKKLVKNPG